MTRDQLLCALVSATFLNVCYQPNYVSILAFLGALTLLAVLVILPLTLDTKAEALREDLSRQLAKQTAEIETLKSRVEMLALGRR